MKQGLRENWLQFSLLVLINAFVGAMIGIERSIFPTLASQRFGLSSYAAGLSFIVAFGIAKALTNYVSGKLSDQIGRKRTLLLGWLLALPIPILFLNAGSWTVIVLTNILLGIHQGLTWSSTVVMKIELVGVKNRGLALGLNEFAGYLSVAVLAYLSTRWVSNFGLDFPFYIGIGIAVVGFILSLLAHDTTHLVAQEQKQHHPNANQITKLWTHPNISTVVLSGFVNNLNDGMVWGLLPMILAAKALPLTQIGFIAGLYPAVWGVGQLFAGYLSDLYCKRTLLFWGMLGQAVALALFMPSQPVESFIIGAILLGLGTAVVYPTFMASIAENTQPIERPRVLGIFRMFRDSGYAFGALISGILADTWGMTVPVVVIALLTFLAALRIKTQMFCLELIK